MEMSKFVPLGLHTSSPRVDLQSDVIKVRRHFWRLPWHLLHSSWQVVIKISWLLKQKISTLFLIWWIRGHGEHLTEAFDSRGLPWKLEDKPGRTEVYSPCLYVSTLRCAAGVHVPLLSCLELRALQGVTPSRDKVLPSRATAGLPAEGSNWPALPCAKANPVCLCSPVSNQLCCAWAVPFFMIHPSPGLGDLCGVFDVFFQVVDLKYPDAKHPPGSWYKHTIKETPITLLVLSCVLEPVW